MQNYLDDTGVQVADVVAGLQHLKGVTSADDLRRAAAGGPLPDGTSHPKGLAYLCWDVYADVAKVYEQNEAARGWRAEVLHAIEAAKQDRAHRRGPVGSDRLGSPRDDGPAPIPYDLLPRESDILRKHFWSRAFELLKGSGAVVREERPPRRVLGDPPLGLPGVLGDGGARQDPRPVQRDRHLHREGHRVPALEVRPPGVDFDYEPFRPEWNSGAIREEEIARDVREHDLWRTAHSEGVSNLPSSAGQRRSLT